MFWQLFRVLVEVLTVPKTWKLDHLAKWLSFHLRTKRLWVRIPLLSLKLHIQRLLRARSSMTFRQTIDCRFTLKLVRDMIKTHSQISKFCEAVQILHDFFTLFQIFWLRLQVHFFHVDVQYLRNCCVDLQDVFTYFSESWITYRNQRFSNVFRGYSNGKPHEWLLYKM